MKVIISGGGTGGHIFPAISIANEIKSKYPDSDILFVGAIGRMEMQRVPKAGYNIVGLPVTGFNRQKLWKNIPIAFKLLKSLIKARKVIKQFKPDVAVGVGGFASGPTLKMAAKLGVPTLIQEQNSYAGVTNKLLAKKANKICVAYEGMERFFPIDKIKLTGNPVRQELLQSKYSKEQALIDYGFDPTKPVVLILGGSLGAQAINEDLLSNYEQMAKSDIQYIWQTGALYIDRIKKELETKEVANIYITDFISDMNKAYTAADLVVSRSGAGSISEFCLLSKAVILIPSPNVAEDHQTKNAMALVEKDAAVMVKNKDTKSDLITVITETINDHVLMERLKENIKQLGVNNSAEMIADEVVKLIKK